MEAVIPRKRVLILGSTGMLGHVIYNVLQNQSNIELFDMSFRTKLTKKSIICDVSKVDTLEKQIKKINPVVIVNCVGVLLKNSKINPANTIFINSYLPHKLRDIAVKINARVIQISTDCVFNGNRGHNSENTLPNASDIYGRSKSLGELNNSFDLTIRTSIIGPELKHNGEGLLHWLFNQSGNIYGYKNVFWSGVTTLELSKAILFSINNETSGLWNLTNGTEISKYDLIEKVINIFQLNKINLKQDNEKTSNKTLISNREIEFKVNSYDKMIVDLKSFYEDNKHFYNYSI